MRFICCCVMRLVLVYVMLMENINGMVKIVVWVRNNCLKNFLIEIS